MHAWGWGKTANMKKRTYLVGYDPRITPLSLAAQEELEGHADWQIKHVFVGLWAVRTRLQPEWVADRFSNALSPGGGAGVVVARIGRKNLVANGLTPQRNELLRRLLRLQ